MKIKKEDYTDLEEELDLEEFKNSVNAYFSSIKDPRECNKTTYPLWHVFFIILSATLAGANCIY